MQSVDYQQEEPLRIGKDARGGVEKLQSEMCLQIEHRNFSKVEDTPGHFGADVQNHNHVP